MFFLLLFLFHLSLYRTESSNPFRRCFEHINKTTTTTTTNNNNIPHVFEHDGFDRARHHFCASISCFVVFGKKTNKEPFAVGSAAAVRSACKQNTTFEKDNI
jgi:hypothetical protein